MSFTWRAFAQQVRSKWMVAEAVPILVPVTFAGCFGVYSLVKKMYVDPEVMLFDTKGRGQSVLERDLSKGEDLLQQRGARVHKWIKHLDNEFDVEYGARSKSLEQLEQPPREQAQ